MSSPRWAWCTVGESGLWSPLTVLIIVLGLASVVQVVLLWGAASGEGQQEAGDVSRFHWHLIVIGADQPSTIEPWVHTALARFPDAHVWWVDARAGEHDALLLHHIDAEHGRVHLIRPAEEGEPVGRCGSLNAAWRRIGRHGAALGHHPDLVVVGVIDGLSMLEPSALHTVAGPSLLGDRAVGGVQLGARAADRSTAGTSTTTSWRDGLAGDGRDLELVGPVGGAQRLRGRIGSVALMADGYLVRLSLLDDIASWAGAPFHARHLEGRQLGLSALLGGWRLAFTDRAWVERSGDGSPAGTLSRRAADTEQVMQWLPYVRPVLASTRIGWLGRLEICASLLAPWCQMVGVALGGIAATVVALELAATAPAWSSAGAGGGVLVLAAGPFFAWGIWYRARVEPNTTRARAGLVGLSAMVTSVVGAIASWWGFARHVSPTEEWDAPLPQVRARPGPAIRSTVGGRAEPAEPVPGASSAYRPKRIDPAGRPTVSYTPRRASPSAEADPAGPRRPVPVAGEQHGPTPGRRAVERTVEHDFEAEVAQRYDEWTAQLSGPRVRLARRIDRLSRRERNAR